MNARQQRRQQPPRSVLWRAVAPVAGGIVVIAAILAFTWVLASWISGGGTQPSELLAPTRLPLGSTQNAAASVANDGPILIQDLGTTDGDRAVVVDHTGDDANQGWRVYYAFPVGRPDCPVEQVPGTREFIDCDGESLTADDLARPTEPIRPGGEPDRTP